MMFTLIYFISVFLSPPQYLSAPRTYSYPSCRWCSIFFTFFLPVTAMHFHQCLNVTIFFPSIHKLRLQFYRESRTRGPFMSFLTFKESYKKLKLLILFFVSSNSLFFFFFISQFLSVLLWGHPQTLYSRSAIPVGWIHVAIYPFY